MREIFGTIRKSTAICLALSVTLTQISYGITPAEEEALAKKFMKTVDRQVKLINDPVIQRYVERVGQRIVAVLPPQPFSYHFYVVDEPVYNAFAGPGGHVFINSGLFADMESHEEMAAILGHEISHVACRHISDRIEKSKKVGIGTIAGLAAAIGLGIAGAGAAANAALVGSLAAGQQLMLAYSREDEIQADQRGVVYLTDAGYSAEGLLDALKRIRSRQWFGKDIVPTYMMTHPALEDRIAYVGGWVDSHPDRKKQANPSERTAFVTAQNRLIALYLDPETALKRLKDKLAHNPDVFSSPYGYGLLMMRTGDLSSAEVHMKKALGMRPLDPDLLADLGQVYFFQGRYDEAGRVLSGSLGMSPENQNALFYMGRTRLAASDFGGARDVLEKLEALRSDFPEIQYYLANAQEGLGRKDLSAYHLALHYEDKADWENAIGQMKRAISLSQDPAEKDRMKMRLREFEKFKKSDLEEAAESKSRNLDTRRPLQESFKNDWSRTPAESGGRPMRGQNGKIAW